MKTTKILRVTPAAVAIALFAVWQTAALSQKRGLGERIAGTYFLEVQHTGFPLAHGLVTLTRDGGFLSNDTSDHGANGLVTRDGPVHGTWKQVGPRQVRARTLYFAYDPKGIPKWIARTTGEFDFDRGFDSGTGTLRVERFRMDQDPLSPDAKPVDTLDATFKARRLTVPGPSIRQRDK